MIPRGHIPPLFAQSPKPGKFAGIAKTLAVPPAPPVLGDTFDPDKDGERLGDQYAAVRRVMADGKWRTLEQLAADAGYPAASIPALSARLRDMRRERPVPWIVERRRVAGKAGLWEYAARRASRQ